MRKRFQSAVQSQDTKFRIRCGEPNIGDMYYPLELECIFRVICADNLNNIHFKKEKDFESKNMLK